jgi:hypothetical protein
MKRPVATMFALLFLAGCGRETEECHKLVGKIVVSASELHHECRDGRCRAPDEPETAPTGVEVEEIHCVDEEK